jgi:hypothetical protein
MLPLRCGNDSERIVGARGLGARTRGVGSRSGSFSQRIDCDEIANPFSQTVILRFGPYLCIVAIGSPVSESCASGGVAAPKRPNELDCLIISMLLEIT